MAAWRWLSDTITFGAVTVDAEEAGQEPDERHADGEPVSSVGAKFTEFSWDFGDGARRSQDGRADRATTTTRQAGDYVVRVEATDDLGHTAIGTQTIHVAG